MDDKIMEFHICQECARLKAEELKQHLSISEFLSNLTIQEDLDKKLKDIRCSFCGITFYDFKKKGRLGCANCYFTFKDQLFPIIKKVHSTTQHKGKFPPTVKEEIIVDKKLAILRERLKKAIQIEAYEEAAMIRDQIKELKKKEKSENV